MISAKGFFTSLIVLLLVTPVAGLAQSLTTEMHHVDSVMVELQMKYDPYHLLHADSVQHQSLLVNRYGTLKANPNALKIPGVVWVPEQKGLFEDQEERQKLYGDYSFGDALLDTTLDIFSELFTPKRKTKKK
jgi:hypothetical protein